MLVLLPFIMKILLKISLFHFSLIKRKSDVWKVCQLKQRVKSDRQTSNQSPDLLKQKKSKNKHFIQIIFETFLMRNNQP